jgi:hypothetical protein
MADYTLSIGGSSTMMIRDLGGWVEFWFKTGPSTWNNDQWWSYGANGINSRQKYRLLRGGNWQHFGSVHVSYDQTIRFTIEGAGLGWATTNFFQHIQRSTVPAPPTMQAAYPTSNTNIHIVFTGNHDGGSPVLEWQIGYGFTSSGPSYLVGSSGTSDISGFGSGQRAYFWARGRNAIGWSGWSNRLEAVTWTVPSAPLPATVVDKNQISMSLQYILPENNNNPATLERQIGYGTNPSSPTTFVDDNGGVVLIDDLTPGGTYFVWGRARNSVGWGPWSERTRVDLIAGAVILVGAEWKRAVPYVRVGGVWKVAEPWIKTAGVWKKTSV